MGIPLIPTCEAKYFEESKAIADSKNPKKIKFDTEHHNLILYEAAIFKQYEPADGPGRMFFETEGGDMHPEGRKRSSQMDLKSGY